MILMKIGAVIIIHTHTEIIIIYHYIPALLYIIIYTLPARWITLKNKKMYFLQHHFTSVFHTIFTLFSKKLLTCQTSRAIIGA